MTHDTFELVFHMNSLSLSRKELIRKRVKRVNASWLRPAALRCVLPGTLVTRPDAQTESVADCPICASSNLRRLTSQACACSACGSSIPSDALLALKDRKLRRRREQLSRDGRLATPAPVAQESISGKTLRTTQDPAPTPSSPALAANYYHHCDSEAGVERLASPLSAQIQPEPSLFE